MCFSIFAGDRGLEVCGHGGGSDVPVDLCHSVCGGHAGLISSASLPDSDRSQPAAQLRDSSHMTSTKTFFGVFSFFSGAPGGLQ